MSAFSDLMRLWDLRDIQYVESRMGISEAGHAAARVYRRHEAEELPPGERELALERLEAWTFTSVQPKPRWWKK